MNVGPLNHWAVLCPTPALTPADLGVLTEIEAMRRRLRDQVRAVHGRWMTGLCRFLTADAVAASNSIEGFRVSTGPVLDLARRPFTLTEPYPAE